MTVEEMTPGQLFHALRGHFFNGGGWADYPTWEEYGSDAQSAFEVLGMLVGKAPIGKLLPALEKMNGYDARPG